MTDDRSGRYLQFQYTPNQTGSRLLLTAVSDSDGRTVAYEYEWQNPEILRRVRFETATAGLTATRTYQYQRDIEGSGNWSFLYNITDETQRPAGHYRYVASDQGSRGGRANHTSRDGTAFRSQLTYVTSSPAPGQVSTLDALGATTLREFSVFENEPQLTQLTRSCPGCTTYAMTRTHDPATGKPSGETDFNGNKSILVVGKRGLESCRIEGIATAAASEIRSAPRRVRTTWDENRPLPLQRTVYRPAAPGSVPSPTIDCNDEGFWTPVRETTWTYTDGRIRTEVVRDMLNLGAAPRTTTWSYHGDDEEVDPPVLWGLVRTVTGPTAQALTTYDYYTADDPGGRWRRGDLQTLRQRTSGAAELVTGFLDYDGRGRPRTIVSPAGTMALQYHPRGWLTRITEGTSATVIGYDHAGRISRIATENTSGQVLDELVSTYDAAGRLTRVTDATGAHVEIVPDAFGNPLQTLYKASSGVSRRTLQRQFDAYGRLIGVIGGAQQSRWYTYDGNDNLKCDFDPRHSQAAGGSPPPCPTGGALPGYVAKTLHDALDRVVSHQQSAMDGGETTYNYDVLDNLTVVSPPGDVADTTFQRNGFGEVTQSTSPDTGTMHYPLYDHAGNPEQMTDARGISATYAYDGLGRMTSRTCPNAGENVTYTYDTCTHGAGHLCGLVDESGTIVYAHDARGNVTTKTVTVDGPGTFTAGGTFVTDYTWDGADRLMTLTYPSDRQVRYTRDAAGRITGVYTRPASGAEVAVVTDVQYAPFGPIEAMDFGNGIEATVTLDADYRVTAIDHGGASLGYQRDAADNVTQETDVQPLGRGYDTLSRLTMADDYYAASATEGYYYDYDANGNRSRKIRYTTDTWFNSLYTLDPLTSNRLRTIVPGGQPWESSIDPEQVRTYDAAGNVTSIDYVGASSYMADVSIAYGGHGRPTQVTTGGLLTVAIGHNGLGQRVRMDVTGGSLQGSFPDKTLHYDESGHLIAEYRSTGEAYEYILNRPGISGDRFV